MAKNEKDKKSLIKAIAGIIAILAGIVTYFNYDNNEKWPVNNNSVNPQIQINNNINIPQNTDSLKQTKPTQEQIDETYKRQQKGKG
jgi:hypothetical protein